jgi:cyclopropane fatty-acyl-phospholipid synthase-like methyltransferase
MNEQFQKDYDRFKNLNFEDFKKLAEDDSLSVYQKIGFPDTYRKEKEKLIFDDIVTKLDLMGAENKVLLDIGSGCSDLAHYIINISKEQNFQLLLVDSKEMLDLLPDEKGVEKHYGYFPDQTEDLVNQHMGRVDYIICYSIFHYVFYNTCIFKFLDVAVSLLKPGGKLLIGDIPSISKRKRFFSTEQGIKYHQEFTKSDTTPDIKHSVIEPAQIDDGVVFSILQRYRNFGLETYVLPQPKTLPMWNRREDILIEKN